MTIMQSALPSRCRTFSRLIEPVRSRRLSRPFLPAYNRRVPAGKTSGAWP